LRSHQLCSYSRLPQHLMKPENSLPCSSWARSIQSIPPNHISLRSILILSRFMGVTDKPWVGLVIGFIDHSLYSHS
jgi:hypothetical protein